jgi:TM2 domain-containing membrane protein YozV
MQEVESCADKRPSELRSADGCSSQDLPEGGVGIVTTPQDNAQERKNPGIAGVASIVLPGLGQIYNGQTRKGIALVIVSVFSLYVLISYRTIVSELADLLYLVILLYSAYDAYNTAKSINLGAA